MKSLLLYSKTSDRMIIVQSNNIKVDKKSKMLIKKPIISVYSQDEGMWIDNVPSRFFKLEEALYGNLVVIAVDMWED